jgi:hypothetical protein
MMEALSTSETSSNLYEATRCNIPQDSDLDSLTEYGQFQDKTTAFFTLL